MNGNQSTVLLVGITGMLGGKIAEALLDDGRYRLRALVRPGGTTRPEVQRFAERGVELVEGDVRDAPSLAPVTEGVEAVVSALSNDPGLIVEGQANLLRAAEATGVRRFVPSDFSVDYRLVDYGDNDNLDMRKRFHEVLMQSPVEHTLVLQGAFTEMLTVPGAAPYDAEANTFRYWGDGEQAMDYTTVEDTARYVAAAVLDPELANQALMVAGDQVSFRQIGDAVEEITGKAVKRESLGTPDELRRHIAEKKAAGGNPWEWLAPQYQWTMITGKAKLNPVMNGRYPQIRPTTVPEFLRGALTQAGGGEMPS